eukprot:9641372-Alexandrium_andersonii.AAC.1
MMGIGGCGLRLNGSTAGALVLARVLVLALVGLPAHVFAPRVVRVTILLLVRVASTCARACGFAC